MLIISAAIFLFLLVVLARTRAGLVVGLAPVRGWWPCSGTTCRGLP